MGFYPVPIGIFRDIKDKIMEKHLCGEVYNHFDGREITKMRCTHLKNHKSDHGWITDSEFKEIKKLNNGT